MFLEFRTLSDAILHCELSRSLFPLAELGSDEHGGADRSTSVSGDESVHCVAGWQSGRRHVAEFVPCGGRECHKGKQAMNGVYFLPRIGMGFRNVWDRMTSTLRRSTRKWIDKG